MNPHERLLKRKKQTLPPSPGLARERAINSEASLRLASIHWRNTTATIRLQLSKCCEEKRSVMRQVALAHSLLPDCFLVEIRRRAAEKARECNSIVWAIKPSPRFLATSRASSSLAGEGEGRRLARSSHLANDCERLRLRVSQAFGEQKLTESDEGRKEPLESSRFPLAPSIVT